MKRNGSILRAPRLNANDDGVTVNPLARRRQRDGRGSEPVTEIEAEEATAELSAE
jgi:hypothetical protein